MSKPTQFDSTTERKAEEFGNSHSHWNCVINAVIPPAEGFAAGRTSTKASLEILARAIKEECWCHENSETGVGIVTCDPCLAIAAVKANGDYPLEDL